ncbi:MAG: alpha/beta fold hydrolase [Candidatus Hodarchaeota archaeon]
MIKIPIFKYDDIEINYIKEGIGEPLVLIQGSNTRLEAWNYQIDFFKERMTIIAFDNRGAGKSSRPDYPYTMDMYVEDTKNLLNYLNIKEKIHLCGISLGGEIAQEFILKYPERVKTLILIATEPNVDPTKFSQTIKVYHEMDKMNFDQKFQLIFPILYTNTFKRKLRKDEELMEKLKKEMNFMFAIEYGPKLKDLINQFKALADFNTIDSLHKIIQPTLILVGSKDIRNPPERSKLIHEKISNSKLEILENLKHGLTIEAPEIVNNAIWNFIKENLR